MTVDDDHTSAVRAAQCARVIDALALAKVSVTLVPSVTKGGFVVMCDGELFYGPTPIEALSQTAQWLNLREGWS